ncbi:FAD-binding protein, partial [Escherichia coli]|nr:FAD-binding protein [Escherichia coli]
PRDKVSQAFWHEQQKGNTIKHPLGDVVHLDLRHLGEEYLQERLPFICELAKAYVNVDPAKEPIPIRPTVHYTMGGIETISALFYSIVFIGVFMKTKHWSKVTLLHEVVTNPNITIKG